jgi:hypothetical protein
VARIALDSEWLASTTTGINEAAGAALEAIRDDVALTRTIHRANSLAMEFANLLCNRPTLSAVPVESWSVPHYQRLFDDVSTIERECRQIGELDAEQNLSRTIAFGTLSQRLQGLLHLATNPLPNATSGGSQTQVEIPSGKPNGDWWATTPPPTGEDWYEKPLIGTLKTLARCIGKALRGDRVDVDTLANMHGKSVWIFRVNYFTWQAYFHNDILFSEANVELRTVLDEQAKEAAEKKAELKKTEKIKTQTGTQKGAKRSKQGQTG